MNTLKTITRKLCERLVGFDALWIPFSKTFVRGSQFLCSQRDKHEADLIVGSHPQLREAIGKGIVLRGPFKGMEYGGTKALCSALYPKILGVYEHEIEPAIEAALQRNHATIVDVGAADGYYAVGFAFRNRSAKVIAYDQDVRARAELAKLAKLNGVSERISIRGRCEPPDIAGLGEGSGLMIVDCEGFEGSILSPANISRLGNWDFIIETHDGFVPGITKELEKRFAATHLVEIVESVHDLDKIDTVDIPLLEGLPRRAANRIVAEGREHACLRWLVCCAKNRQNP